ncbi:unnamed protein product [Rotaria sp. Silwood1]|nr:unnamed protein product [Rotaria sp. Silwood1]CAF0742133.1 unnamed protein product [Rotaria sp. Silwood1]CAF3350503.1 unnamed protein product [Rotaria sp. Silwood1]CAF3355406.1 unnamed protein product [Rotaria sp. Silwood1]CAF4484191.1 unnamed protein product [Rotaria sp. Silwood1]
MIVNIFNKLAYIQFIRRSFHTTYQLKCGVLSYFYYSPSSNKCFEKDQQSLLNGLRTLKHRGPDELPSFWINQENTVGLGHTRLAIIDLSEHGRQPLHSFDTKLHLSMNGELYDHDRIRQEAIENDNYQFTSKSDSEIAMYLYRKYGLTFVNYLRGEFAITMYDEQRKIFIAVRDRFGIKPLYYTYFENKLLFASEIKALFAFGHLNEEVIYNMGQLRSLQTIYKNIQQLPPGHLLIATDNGTINISKYYDLTYITREEEKKEKRTEHEMIDGVHQRLLEAVRLRMRADVTVGVYLSGGLDSSVLLGMATTFTNKPINTYSISFKDHHYFNEQSLCIRTNEFLREKTKPYIIELTHNELADYIDDCIYHYEYPLVQLSPVGKFLLSKLVNDNKGKVVLTGEGSDEIFAGYSFFRQDYLLHDIQNDPIVNADINEEERKHLLKSLLSNLLSRSSTEKNKLYEMDAIQTIGYVPSDASPPSLLTQKCFAQRLQEKYRDFPLNSFYYNQSYLYDYHIKQQMLNYKITRAHSTEYLSIKKSLLNILLKVFGDRSEMAHSVEGRTPYLDHYLVDYVNHLPTNMKLKLINGKLLEKYILRQVGRPYITNEIYQREKHPFLAPPTFLDRNSKVYQYMQDTLNSKDIQDLDYIFDIEHIRNSLNQLHKRQKEMENKLQLRELVSLEGFYLMLCSYITLKRRFNVKHEGQ